MTSTCVISVPRRVRLGSLHAGDVEGALTVDGAARCDAICVEHIALRYLACIESRAHFHVSLLRAAYARSLHLLVSSHCVSGLDAHSTPQGVPYPIHGV